MVSLDEIGYSPVPCDEFRKGPTMGFAGWTGTERGIIPDSSLLPNLSRDGRVMTSTVSHRICFVLAVARAGGGAE